MVGMTDNVFGLGEGGILTEDVVTGEWYYFNHLKFL
jgi:hypothetical protein